MFVCLLFNRLRTGFGPASDRRKSIISQRINRNSDRNLELQCYLGKEKVYLLLISISSYLPLMYIYFIFMIYDLAFFSFFVKVMARVKANDIFCVILGKKQLIMIEFAKCGISNE